VVESKNRLTKQESLALLRIAAVMTGRPVDEKEFLADAFSLFASLDSFHQHDLRTALRIADGEFGGLLVLRLPRSLSSLDHSARAERFDRMRRSRLLFVRKIYIGLQRLSVALHYSNPKNFSDVGYPGPPAVASE